MSGEHHYFATTLNNWWACETALEAIQHVADFCKKPDDFWLICRVPVPKGESYEINRWVPQVPGTLVLLGSAFAERDDWIHPVVSFRDLERRAQLLKQPSPNRLGQLDEDEGQGLFLQDCVELCRNHGFDP